MSTETPSSCPFEVPFTMRDVDSRGLTRAAVRGWLERGECRRVAHGLYAATAIADSAAMRLLFTSRHIPTGRIAVSALAAARLHKLAVPRAPHASTLRPIALRDLPADCRTGIGHFVLPSVEWTSLLLARGQRLPGALIPIDAAARIGCNVELLADLYSRMTRWPGVAQIGRAINELDGNSGSALESASRGWMLEQKLPRPVLQHPFAIDGAQYYVDFYWPDAAVIGEADGLSKYDDRREIRRERARQSALDSTCCRVLRWGWDDLEERQAQLHRTLRGALHC